MCFRQKRAANKRNAFDDSVNKVFRINFFLKEIFSVSADKLPVIMPFPTEVPACPGINSSHFITSDNR
jgi:hypothetical protein